ncbi:unnamed protein product, partial [Amoebophrya sp. A120]|eukprot:GSA120T00020350001.1
MSGAYYPVNMLAFAVLLTWRPIATWSFGFPGVEAALFINTNTVRAVDSTNAASNVISTGESEVRQERASSATAKRVASRSSTSVASSLLQEEASPLLQTLTVAGLFSEALGCRADLDADDCNRRTRAQLPSVCRAFSRMDKKVCDQLLPTKDAFFGAEAGGRLLEELVHKHRFESNTDHLDQVQLVRATLCRMLPSIPCSCWKSLLRRERGV